MTTLLEQLQSDVKQAMKARDSDRVQTLRLFVNAIQVEAKNQQRDLDGSEEIAVLQRERKKRIEAAEAFDAGDAADRAAEERRQGELLDTYLPAQLTPEELQTLVTNAIAEAGAESPKDMGAVMKVLVPKVAGRADGKELSGAVQQALRAN